jgi:glycosyltransferase involved in cell wall biosynthesis
MKLLMLNADDSRGGAAIATYRLHRGLRSIGVDSYFLVMNKYIDDVTIIAPARKTVWQRIQTRIFFQRDLRISMRYLAKGKNLFSPARSPENLAQRVSTHKPDVIHLFWMNSGFMKIETLEKLKKPIVWTLHDMWPFTGGCHYDDECGKFKQSCGKCPLLDSDYERDLSRQVWARKQKSWRNVPVVVVATSYWLAEMARSSSLFKDKRIEVIPNGIDTNKYQPLDKRVARDACGLPQDKKLVLFSAFNVVTDKRKGNQFFVPALRKMAEEGWGENTELVVIGASLPENPPDLGLKVHYMGHLSDEISQVLLYAAADVTVAPSMQENLSNTVMESLSCGTPVVAFNIGGMPDMINHQQNGYLATPFEKDELAAGIMWVLEDNVRHDTLSQRARQTVLERYSLKLVAHRYLALYESIRG